MKLENVMLAVLVTFASLGSAHGQASSSKTIRLIVGFPPSGATDIVARSVGQKFSEKRGQPVVVDNRPGASGTIAADLVAKSPGDGYTLLVSSATSTAIAASLYPNLPYDVLKDLAIITVVGSSPALLVTHPSLPPKTFREFIPFAKANNRALTFGGAGLGSSGHLTGELFNLALNLKMTHVPYKGEPPALVDVAGGHISFMFSSLPVCLPLAKAGKVRGLAVTSLKRAVAAPSYPTVAESGVPGFESISWNAIYAPGTTPRDLVQRLNVDSVSVINTPEVNERLATQGIEPVANSLEDAAKFLRSEMVKWGKVIKAANVRVE